MMWWRASSRMGRKTPRHSIAQKDAEKRFPKAEIVLKRTARALGKERGEGRAGLKGSPERHTRRDPKSLGTQYWVTCHPSPRRAREKWAGFACSSSKGEGSPNWSQFVSVNTHVRVSVCPLGGFRL